MKWIKRISLALLFLLLVLLTIIGWIVTTQSGLHFILNTTTKWLPGLEIATISGGWSNLNLQGIHYQINGINVDVNKFNLSLQINCLKHFQLCVHNISTEGVNIKIDSKALLFTEKPNSSKPLTKLFTPYPILLNQLILENISIQFDDTQVLLAKLTMAANWQANLLTIKPSIINGLKINLPKPSVVKNKATEKPAIKTSNKVVDKKLTETFKALFAKPLLTKLPDVVLPIDINIEQIRGTNWYLAGDTKVVIDNLTLMISIKNQQIVIKQFNVVAPEGNITLTGNVNFTQQWKMNIKANALSYINDLKGQQVNLKLKGSLLQKLKLILSLTGPVNTNLVAEVALSQAGLPIQLTLKSQQLNWPLQGEPEYRLQDLYLNMKGKMMGYDLSLRTNIDGRNAPPTLLTLEAKGNAEHFKLTSLRLNALQGKTELTGMIVWNKGISWNWLLTLSDINTAKQWPQWPAKLHGQITTIGNICGDSWQFKIPKINLDGNIKDNLLRIRGEISGNANGQWDIPIFNILFGRNKLTINGHVNKKWQLDGIIDAPVLDSVLNGLTGIIKGQLKLQGDLKSPQLITVLSAYKVKWQNTLAIDKTIIQGDIGFDKQIYGQLTVDIHKLKQANLIVQNFHLDAKGNEQQHSVKMNVDEKHIAGHITIKGSFDRQKALWKGVLDNTLFNTPIGTWQLNQPVMIKYANQQQRVTLSEHCWLNTKGNFCLSKTTEIGKSGNIHIILKHFDLTMIKLFLPTDTTLTGSFNSDAQVSWYEDGRSPQAKVNMFSNSIKIKQLIEESWLLVEFKTLILNLDISNGKTALQWLIQINNNGKFSGNMQIDNLEHNSKLSGTVNIENIFFELIRPVLNKGQSFNSNLNANLSLSGNMKQPLLNGNLTLSHVSAKGPWFPFDINQSFIKLNFIKNYSKLIGIIKTPEGFLKLTGEADWRNIESWQARIFAKGEKLRITLPPMIRIDVEPDIVLKATPHLLTLNGNINIPWARIIVQELPESVIDVSLDEVMLNKHLHPIEQKSMPIPTLIDLKIKIGNEVRLNAFDLKAQLKGKLQIIQDKQGLALNGQINIFEGRFHTYGQDLIVRKGQILFSGPVEQPFLNIEAIRNKEKTNDNVIAGVRITGLANKPKITIFSEPLKSQEEALSYLLRGEGFDGSIIDSAHMATLLISVGVSNSGKLLGSIGKIFGISDLELSTKGAGNKSQVIVSGKITNNLQVRYGVGIFHSLTILMIRYHLMPQLYLEVLSGIDQALDLLYQLEF